ncbi:hypothetical protein IFM89_028445 [Coptis chinensis]|uniref:Pentatricopeptide repeat-containing protein n=1 Tax=Coptis chinensis TaxID=261450 RepID=A0A835IT83_9MAGN|nr:hypothetical protein IFM89_028445 [Coptis chinensis]
MEMKSKGYNFDSFGYCTVISVLAKLGLTREANYCIGEMVRNGIGLDLVAYNTLFNVYCREGKLENAFGLANELQKCGMESDQYTHTILVDGMCRSGDMDGAERHLKLMEMKGFKSNFVASNCLLNGLCQAMKVFGRMEYKDDFTYSCKAKQFFAAARLIKTSLIEDVKVLKSAQKATVFGLRSTGYKREASQLQSAITVAKYTRY